MIFGDASTCGGISDKMKIVTVKTPSRLHMGILDVNGGLGRIYGSLGLAVAKSLATLYQIDGSTRELAGIIGRGTVSGIGTAAFDHGGFNIDGGVPTEEESRRLPAPIIFSRSFPEDWVLVVAIPHASKGYSGPIEDRAFADLPSAPPELVGRMCRVLVMKLLPALVESDIRSFGSALTELQRVKG